MTIDPHPLQVRIVQAAQDIDAKIWDDICGLDHPFTRHSFFTALERSGSATAETGWQPCHLVAETEDGMICGLLPTYLKSHSYGEYVFDHGWAGAFERAGGRYYPKLQISVPFTPSTGPRLHAKESHVKTALLEAAQRFCDMQEISGAHITFMEKEEAEIAQNKGFLIRHDEQFHWQNKGYDEFDDFLDALASRKRKTIRKERKQVLESDLEIEILTGSDIEEAHWDAFYSFYMDTGRRKWGTPYLNRDFFSLIGETMGDAIVLMLANRDDSPIAGALNFKSSGTLYGRYWGAIEHHPYLHFELCFYQAIDYAIRHGLSRVEAGAQGQHKIARGYEPVMTTSAHWLRDPGFHQAVSQFLDVEKREVGAEIQYLSRMTPFKKNSGL